MKRDPTLYVSHILDSIDLIERYVVGMSHDDFVANIETQDSVMRRLEIIGEAAKCLVGDFRNQHPEIPWKSISGMRDKLIHEYFGVDLDLVWNVVKKDVPELKESLKKLTSIN